MSLRILFTNNTLHFRSGTEVYVRDVAASLLARGHVPLAYSTRLGDVARELARLGVPVSDDLGSFPQEPDIIHGQHHMDAMRALLHFPSTPGVFFCHGWRPWVEIPPDFPRIYRYVAVDEHCLQRTLEANGGQTDRSSVLLNFVDLDRFRPRPPLPQRPAKALIFSNTIQPENVERLLSACSRKGLEADLLGAVSGSWSDRPEELLGRYDLIFAKGRGALESMAVGAAVILCSEFGMGPMVRSGDFERWRVVNFGSPATPDPVTEEGVALQIDRYDPKDAALVSRRVREEADREVAVDRILEIYREAIEEHRRTPSDPKLEMRCAGRYLESLTSCIRGCDEGILKNECQRLREEIERLNGTRAIRLRNRLLKMPLVGRAAKMLVR